MVVFDLLIELIDLPHSVRQHCFKPIDAGRELLNLFEVRR